MDRRVQSVRRMARPGIELLEERQAPSASPAFLEPAVVAAAEPAPTEVTAEREVMQDETSVAPTDEPAPPPEGDGGTGAPQRTDSTRVDAADTSTPPPQSGPTSTTFNTAGPVTSVRPRAVEPVPEEVPRDPPPDTPTPDAPPADAPAAGDGGANAPDQSTPPQAVVVSLEPERPPQQQAAPARTADGLEEEQPALGDTGPVEREMSSSADGVAVAVPPAEDTAASPTRPAVSPHFTGLPGELSADLAALGDDLDKLLAGLDSSDGATGWLLAAPSQWMVAAALALAAGELGRRQWQRSRRRLPAGLADGALLLGLAVGLTPQTTEGP